MKHSHSHKPRAWKIPLCWTAVALGGAAVAWSCQGDIGSTFDPNAPCATVLAQVCGGECTDDGNCPAGTHCDSTGHCYADCVPGDARCGGLECDENGRCVEGAGGSSSSFNPTQSGGAGGTTSGAGGACGSLSIDFEPVIPTVVLLVDQSGSMNIDFNGLGMRWDVLYDALMNPVDGVVQALEDNVRFALTLYTYTSGPVCPELVEVQPPALNAHAAIDTVYAAETYLSNTPTGDSLTQITPPIVAFAEPGPKLIILATDGDPDRCENPDGHDNISKQETIDAAQAAYAQGIETVIIAVGDDVADQHQQDVANAGSGRPVPAPFPCDPIADPANCAQTFEPTTKQALIDAFLGVILGQRDCTFALSGEVIPGMECEGTVTINGVTIPCNDPDGWHLNGTDEIEFDGDACQTILTELDVDIEAEFPCEALVNPPD